MGGSRGLRNGELVLAVGCWEESCLPPAAAPLPMPRAPGFFGGAGLDPGFDFDCSLLLNTSSFDLRAATGGLGCE